MEGFVMAIGLAAIIYFVIYVGGSIAESNKDQEIKLASTKINVTNAAYRVAARKIYFQTDDEKIKEKVKFYAHQYLGGWGLLELEMSDEEYRTQYKTLEAEKQIEIKGSPLVIQDEEIESLW